MKRIIICGNASYCESVKQAIVAYAENKNLEIPQMVLETQDSNNLLSWARDEKHPIFILDKELPSAKNSTLEQNGMFVASRIRRTRGESVEQYSLPYESQAFIVLFSDRGYSFQERGDMSQFWSQNMFLVKGRDVQESEIAEMVIGTQVFNEAWMFPAIAKQLRNKFSDRAG